MRATACLALISLVIGGGLVASAKPRPNGLGWTGSTSIRRLSSRRRERLFPPRPGWVLVLEKRKSAWSSGLDETGCPTASRQGSSEERETKGGQLVEISRNFFAFNTADRGVYYFGEEVDIYKNGRSSATRAPGNPGRTGPASG